MDFFKDRLLPAINTLSVVIGIVLAVAQLQGLRESAEGSLEALRIQSISHVNRFVDQYYDNQDPKNSFLSRDLNALELEIKQRIDSGQTGQELYHSYPALADFKVVASFWERLGALIYLDYIKFSIIYETLPFPDRFYRETQAIRTILGENWYGKNQPLPEFLLNTERLKQRYDTQK